MSKKAKPQATVTLPIADFKEASISIPMDCLSTYSMIRSEQLKVLADIVLCQTQHFQIELSNNDVGTLSSLVNQLAAENEAIISALTEIASKVMKGDES